MKKFKIVDGPNSFSSSKTWKIGFFELAVVNTRDNCAKTLVAVAPEVSGMGWRDFYVWLEGAHYKITAEDCIAVYGQARKGKTLLDGVFNYGKQEGRRDIVDNIKTLLGIN